MYSLYIDKPSDFACEVQVKNASLKNAFARMIIKTDDVSLLFEGKIENGKCVIPIGRLKGLLDENSKGKMKLEIVVDDTYFSPWSDDFLTEEHTSVKINEISTKSNKPSIQVKLPPKEKPSIIEEKRMNIWLLPTKEIVDVCKKIGITKSNIKDKKQDLQKIIKEYFKENPELISKKSVILENLKYLMK